MKNKKQRRDEHFEKGNAIVYIDDMADFEKCIRKFKKMVKKSGVLEKFVEKQTFEKPSDRKRRKKNQQKRRIAKENKAAI